MRANDKCQVKKSHPKKKPILKTVSYEEESPPPYAPLYHPRQQQNASDGNNQGAVGQSDQMEKQKVESPSSRPPSPATQRTSPIAARTRSQLLAPLHQVDQRILDGQGQVEIQPLFQYVPFTTTDLLNWKQHYGPLSAKPQEVIDLFRVIIKTHNPTWQELEQLMTTLLNGEERERLNSAIGKILKPVDGGSLQAALNLWFPRQDPQWDPYGDMTVLREYQALILQGLEQAAKPPVNMSKPSLVIQKTDESPEAFFQRIYKYQALLTHNPQVTLKQTNALNPATLLPIPGPEIEHNCMQVIESQFLCRPDLTDVPLKPADHNLFTDGSSFITMGERYAGYAVVSLDRVIESGPLPKGTSNLVCRDVKAQGAFATYRSGFTSTSCAYGMACGSWDVSDDTVCYCQCVNMDWISAQC
ncbi:PREDICTED: uncharacterized protein LOC106544426 [Thamnophis sirtalis]|uniref:Uncharacterized protein LOC106544426 n=1 Tax=Thamnophis sirtalis TaxID=35019 RepID=A0A6I9Y820_9SAUR|nr:PREDICTED: uncharacterized protein LOC106544426 [Thamnophis sirtalis]